MKAYKYVASELVESILGGSFRIGTLYDFRRSEKHEVEIADPNEGRSAGNTHLLSWDSVDPTIHAPQAQRFVHGPGVRLGSGESITLRRGGMVTANRHGVSMRNAALRSEFSVQDLYVFCVTLKAETDAMRRAGYDACLEIADIHAFFEGLGSDAGLGAGGWGIVQYQSRELHFEAALQNNPAYIKEPQFSYQREARGLWFKEGPLSPLIARSDTAAKLCRRIERL